MCAASVIDFMEPPATMTFDEGLELVARCRRQLDLVVHRHSQGKLVHGRITTARLELDDLEKDILATMKSNEKV